MSVPVDDLRDSGPHRTRVGPWRLQSRLGEGGMGVVHLAAGPDGRRVALKVLRPHVVSDTESRERLAREVALLRRVGSPRVAEVIDADPWHEVPWVATRYVPGWNLHEHVRSEGPLAGRDLRWFARCLAEALAAVHATGVVHRDVKPANVLLEGRSPVLIDFGLARLAEDTRLTQAGFLMGTPGYLAPEVLTGAEATAAADVHGLGACIAYAASGTPPFGSGPAVAVMDRVRRGEHDLSGLDEGIRPMVTACLDPDPTRRPDAATLVAALRAVPDTDAAAYAPVRAPDPAGTPAARPSASDLTAPLVLGGAAAGEGARERASTALLRSLGRAVPTRRPGGAGDTGATRDTGQAGDATRTRREVAPTVSSRPTDPPTTRMPTSRTPPGRVPGPDRSTPPRRVQPVAASPSPPRPSAPYASRPVHPAEAGAVAAALRVGLLAVVVSFFVAAPFVATGTVLLAAHGLRTWSWTAQAHREKVWRRGGRRWHDAPLAVLASPWYALVALGGTIVLALWVVLVVGLVAGVATLAALPLAPTLVAGGVVLAAACVGGPGGRRVRTGVTLGVRRVAASRAAGLVVLGVLALLVAVLAFSGAPGPSWVPFGAPADLLRSLLP